MEDKEVIKVTRYDLKFNTYQVKYNSNLKYTKERKRLITNSVGNVMLKMIKDIR